MDIGRPETYQKFKSDILKTLFLKNNNTIRDALNKIDKNGINIILIVDDEEEIHNVTKLALQDVTFKGKSIEFLLRKGFDYEVVKEVVDSKSSS